MNYSRQRESILNVLANNFEHPTAYMIYNLVKVIEPNISQSTVYRNLEQLVKLGMVRKLSCGDGCEHYDLVRDNHSHAICKNCGNIFDVFLNIDNMEKLIKQQIEFFNCEEILVMGICKNCKKEKK